MAKIVQLYKQAQQTQNFNYFFKIADEENHQKNCNYILPYSLIKQDFWLVIVHSDHIKLKKDRKKKNKHHKVLGFMLYFQEKFNEAIR